jgi:hypothetical protein
MKTSDKQKGWGTLSLLMLMVMISACAAEKKPARVPESRFGQSDSKSDYFSLECNPGQRNGIVGGQAVRASDADSNRSILLIWEDASGKQSLCSATLIADQTLLTAAHCVNEAVKMQAVFYTDVSCVSGYQRSQHAIAVDKTISHPDYNTKIESLSVLDENIDLALVHLVKKAPERFQIFKISNNPEELTSNVFLYGFGVTGTSKKDPMLLRKTVVQRADIFFTNKALFFDQENKTGVCSGDSGGAGLMEDNGELVIASVNSEVFNGNDVDSADLCNRHSKSIVVHHYLDSWIIPTMAQWGQNLK